MIFPNLFYKLKILLSTLPKKFNEFLISINLFADFDLFKTIFSFSIKLKIIVKQYSTLRVCRSNDDISFKMIKINDDQNVPEKAPFPKRFLSNNIPEQNFQH
jgi:hypothetical protein